MSNTADRVITLMPLDEHDVASFTQELLDLAAPYDLSLSEDMARTCVSHLLYVQQVNTYMNLTRIVDMHEALTLHILDSLLLTRVLPVTPSHFLDMGTGAGFPGIPFHIFTGSYGVLLDSVGKKIKAVSAFIDALGLHGIQGVHARLEEYALREHRAFDLVCARAVGQLPLLIEYATPFLEEDGYLLLAKANPDDDELSSGLKAASICGLKLVRTDEFDLPEGLGHRTVLLYQKVGNPKIQLPRPTGTAKRQPLA